MSDDDKVIPFPQSRFLYRESLREGTRASLWFRHEDLDPELLTRLLGQEAAWSHRKGDVKRPRPGAVGSPLPLGYWRRSVVVTDPRGPGDAVRELQALFPASADGWRGIPPEWGPWIELRCDVTDGLRKFELDPDVLEYVQAIGARLLVSLRNDPDEDEDED